jgi:hypothetical protein
MIGNIKILKGFVLSTASEKQSSHAENLMVNILRSQVYLTCIVYSGATGNFQYFYLFDTLYYV